ncbi:DnaD domain protein [Macrococcoides caseolyticum]|uniref:DnaD domain protein n=1 Tax=Macrococcoides caseolyticum TaxID=69966 RepID=UPI000C33FA38|nr:DnaD domain protein [Macrococcus caseolyticus]PKE17795.1 DNA replication protein DnaD [Macrococcus caseolyticus]PKE67391.1 DNA replication protein DnaD [Macrococcus caseolyticus]
MSKLLMDEHPIQVMPTLASHIGLNEAIILQQMHYWLSKSNHKHDGRMWIYNTVKGWAEQFPFWSESTIKRAINNLTKKELVLIGNYNKAKFDKTLWYSIDYEKLDELERVNNRLGQNDLTSSSKRPNGEVQNDQRKESDWSNGEGQDDQTNTIDYTETTTETIPETTTKEDQVAVDDKEFASVYKFYTENIDQTPNNSIIQSMSDDLKEFGYDLMMYVMDIAANNKATRYGYVNTIFKRCRAENIKTVEQAELKAQEKAMQRFKYKNNQSIEITPKWLEQEGKTTESNHHNSKELSDDELEKEREKLRKELEESAREFEDKGGVRHHA